VVVDPLVMPIGAMRTAGQQVFRIVRRLREELGVNTTCGASNIAFGLPHRHSLSAVFISMAAGAGMTSAIVNVMDDDIRRGVAAADVLLGHDADCVTWIGRYREPGAAAGAAAEGAGRRRGGRDARRGSAVTPGP
jgi:5-methyltetrahydrofolate--homocysteine methyltransferase